MAQDTRALDMATAAIRGHSDAELADLLLAMSGLARLGRECPERRIEVSGVKAAGLYNDVRERVEINIEYLDRTLAGWRVVLSRFADLSGTYGDKVAEAAFDLGNGNLPMEEALTVLRQSL